MFATIITIADHRYIPGVPVDLKKRIIALGKNYECLSSKEKAVELRKMLNYLEAAK